MFANESKLLTIKNFVKKYEGGWPHSEITVRNIAYKASVGKNHFKNAFMRIGKRVLVNEKEFWKCVYAQNEEPQSNFVKIVLKTCEKLTERALELHKNKKTTERSHGC